MRSILIGAVAAAAVSAAGLGVASGAAGASPVPSCGNGQLTVTHSHPQGAMGHGNMIVRFKNTGYGTCSLHGYPGFDALGSYGDVIRHAKRKG